MIAKYAAYRFFHGAPKAHFGSRPRFFNWRIVNAARCSTSSSIRGELPSCIILGIESSCDDTGAAVVDSCGQVKATRDSGKEKNCDSVFSPLRAIVCCFWPTIRFWEKRLLTRMKFMLHGAE